MNSQEPQKQEAPQSLLADPLSDHTRKIQDRLLLTSGGCLLWGLGWTNSGLDKPLGDMDPQFVGVVLVVLSTYFCVAYLLAIRADMLRFSYATDPANHHLKHALQLKFADEQEHLAKLLVQLRANEAGVPNPDGMAADSARRAEEVSRLTGLVQRQEQLRRTRNYLELAFPLVFWLTAGLFGGYRLMGMGELKLAGNVPASRVSGSVIHEPGAQVTFGIDLAGNPYSPVNEQAEIAIDSKLITAVKNGGQESVFLPKGDYRIRISAEGFKPIEKEISVKDSPTQTFRFTLQVK